MGAVPIKPEYGPTLGRLLSPRWRAAPRYVRVLVLGACAALAALVVAAVLTLENAHYSHAGRVPFGFSYRSLYRTAPDPGGYVKVTRRGTGGRLKDSFAVAPLSLPPYAGELSGELPLYAAGYIARLQRRYRGFELFSEGKTRVNTIPGYQVAYTARVQGQTMWGRDVLLPPPHPRGVREGVQITMLTTPTADPKVDSPLEVASDGVLLRPVKTFAFG
jgi:hypothetical protein